MPICPFASWRPVQNHSGPMSAHLGNILHVQEGNGSLAGFFNNPNANASSTWWCAKDGTLEQYVDSDNRAWAQAAGNDTYNSVETEGFVAEPLTDAQVATLARLYAWGHDTYGWPYQEANQPGEAGFGVHYMGGQAWGGHPCPGPTRAGQRPAILAAAQGTPTTGDDMTPDQAKQLNDVWQALTNTDAAKDSTGKPMAMHWTVGYIWSAIQRVEAKLDAWMAKHP